MASKYIQVNNENPSDRGAEDGEWRGRTRRVTVLAREATILDDDYQPSNEEDGRLPPENKITAPTIDAFDYVSPNHPLCPTRAICVLDSAQQLARLRHHFEFWWDVLVAMDKQAKMNTNNVTDQRIREVIRLGEENRELRREQDYMTVQRDMAEKRVEGLISKLDGAYRERDRDQSIIALMNTTRQAKPATEGNNRDCVPHRDRMHDAHRFLGNISVDHENCPSSVTNALGTDPGTVVPEIGVTIYTLSLFLEP
ncbi:hypothetical protein NUU61_001534 [Penicillium alfredii]|uniref:Uncharacterized protein n=1 Tax=Penicillium alfredii TaxID=1506179 RepID=A0A9W9G4J3_9EURO|nr:uncharacterized protein NUU61_001534 [Penicillium alfredii]KAJ5111904.1 hypothetical protein NUU61_001534 [Penicillium alfredii]